jgi:hypothetical protein
MRRNLMFAVCIASLLALAADTAGAKVIHYTLMNVNFNAPPLPSGGAVADSSAVGTFDYDTVTQQISNISIVTTSIPGTLDCYETGTPVCPSNSTRVILNYTGSNYISSIPGESGGATAQLVSDPSNGNNQMIVFYSNVNGGGSVSAPGGTTSTKCNRFLVNGCVLSLTIAKNALNGGGVIPLVSDYPNASQSTPGSADPQGNAINASESFQGNLNCSFTRDSFAPGGYLTAGGGFIAFSGFALLVGAYISAQAWRRSRAVTVRRLVDSVTL